MPMWLIILLIVVVILILVFISCYNSLISLRNKVRDQFSQIDIQLKRRSDLIPNVVETVKGYAKHEKSTLEELVKLRNSYNDNGFSVDEAEKINKKFGSVMALAEAYPELKANEQFLSLQNNLVEIENKINDARLQYNNKVTTFNNLVESVPSNIVAKTFGFEKQELFKANEDEKQNIKVSL